MLALVQWYMYCTLHAILNQYRLNEYMNRAPELIEKLEKYINELRRTVHVFDVSLNYALHSISIPIDL